MQKSTLPVGIKTLKNWFDKGMLNFEHPVQRAGGQWNLLQKSLLLHSILANYPIPAIYLIKEKDEDGNVLYSAIECKQRLTSIFEFIGADGYALHAATPLVKVDGFEHDLANMKFEDLADELKDEILGYRFSIVCLEDCTDAEIEEIFTRLNNSTPLTTIQKARAVMGTELARWCKEMCSSPFFEQSVNLTLAQSRRESDLEVLLQSMLLLDSRKGIYDNWSAISTAEVTKYCKHIRGTYDDDRRLEIMEILEYLSKAFPTKHKFLKKSNIPTVVVLTKLALENDIDAESFKTFIDAFSNTVCVEYDENTGSGNVKRTKTEGRLLAIANIMKSYFNLDELNILYIPRVDSETDGPTEETPAEIENSGTTTEEVTEDTADMDERSVDNADDASEDTTENSELSTTEQSLDEDVDDVTENNDESDMGGQANGAE